MRVPSTRWLPIIPLAVAVCLAFGGARMMPARSGAWLLAAEWTGAVTLLASCGLVLASARNASPATMAQVALGASVGHLLLVGMGSLLTALVRPEMDVRGFALATLGCYWIQLCVLALIAIRCMRQSSLAAIGNQNPRR